MNNLQHKFNRACLVALCVVFPLVAIFYLLGPQNPRYALAIFPGAILIAIANEIRIAIRHKDRSQYL